MRIVPDVYSLINPLTVEKDYSSDNLKISTSNLQQWASQVTGSVNQINANQKDHDFQIGEIVKRVAALETFSMNAKDFLEWIAGAHPEMLKEYAENREASKRLAP